MQDKKNKYLTLKAAKSKPELAKLLGLAPRFFTKVIYKINTDNSYHSFQIDKKSGGTRTIDAPSSELKEIQRKLSSLLLDCREHLKQENQIMCDVSHGFERELSITTNAQLHKKKKCVLNLDLEDFFGSFNFGRVRGYFLKNKSFVLDPEIATAIAKIACYDNRLPQGSPCSPVITNFITNVLDMRLSSLARKCGCTYSRYADDITFSTRKEKFNSALVKSTEPEIELGRKLTREIERAGFKINKKKTRILKKDSRQEVTGLVTNSKVSIKSDYWRRVRAMTHQLYTNGSFYIEESRGTRDGSIKELEGYLHFINSIDHFNHKKNSKSVALARKKDSGLLGYKSRLNSREKNLSSFLHYKYFWGTDKPTLITEGKTDIVYLKAALNSLQKNFPELVEDTNNYAPALTFFKFSPRTEYFMDFHADGGAGEFIRFLKRYPLEVKKFKKHKPKSPVILLLDNDTGPESLLKGIINLDEVKKNGTKSEDIRKNEFTYIGENLYLVLTPMINKRSDSMIEDLFDKDTLERTLGGKKFNPQKKFNKDKEFSKQVFASKIIFADRKNVNFDGFIELFKRIEKVVSHFRKHN